jgi:hypothetical protein
LLHLLSAHCSAARPGIAWSRAAAGIPVAHPARDPRRRLEAMIPMPSVETIAEVSFAILVAGVWFLTCLAA